MNKRLKNYLSVGIFAFFGGALRAYLNLIWSQAGTFTANIIGCFLLAFFTYFFVEYREGRDWLVTGLSTGFVGSFTTFSSFHLDTLKQLESGMNSQATIYFFSSIFIGFLFAYLGMLVGKRTGRKLAEKA
ncbi:chromosome condensation protein CrcB [Lactobacillus johnsonii 16]|jgi:CrcB protein|uniref:fluoride efflux transporter FluC n=1 Tax=Lactobacillus johnsonii TaxID=33959 RepID=UPI00069DE137|nr:CrcB family protein [Lactobacillus johnsonii]KOH02621.1 chromosome condensation protein CrcB [Lactobacillus johnsonii 16]